MWAFAHAGVHYRTLLLHNRTLSPPGFLSIARSAAIYPVARLSLSHVTVDPPFCPEVMWIALTGIRIER